MSCRCGPHPGRADDAQRRQASEALREKHQETKRALFTALEPLERFYRAEDYHQKYGLRRHAPLMAAFTGYSPGAFTDSTVAARLNGLVARAGDLALFERERAGYGLAPLAEEHLRRAMGLGPGASCGG